MAGWRPFAAALSQIFVPLGAHSVALQVLHGLFFWAHLLLVFGFLVYLGYSKHLHIITSTPNVAFLNLEPKGGLPTPDLEDPDIEHFGASRLEHLSWKDMLDLYTCTECGRCQTHCPAWNTGKPLSPKTLITDLRDHAYEQAAGGWVKLVRRATPRPETESVYARLFEVYAGLYPALKPAMHRLRDAQAAGDGRSAPSSLP